MTETRRMLIYLLVHVNKNLQSSKITFEGPQIEMETGLLPFDEQSNPRLPLPEPAIVNTVQLMQKQLDGAETALKNNELRTQNLESEVISSHCKWLAAQAPMIGRDINRTDLGTRARDSSLVFAGLYTAFCFVCAWS